MAHPRNEPDVLGLMATGTYFTEPHHLDPFHAQHFQPYQVHPMHPQLVHQDLQNPVQSQTFGHGLDHISPAEQNHVRYHDFTDPVFSFATDAVDSIDHPNASQETVHMDPSQPSARRPEQADGTCRPRLTPEQTQYLENMFRTTAKPSTADKSDIAGALGLPLDKVNNWFQNRRAKFKQQKKSQSTLEVSTSRVYSENGQASPDAAEFQVANLEDQAQEGKWPAIAQSAQGMGSQDQTWHQMAGYGTTIQPSADENLGYHAQGLLESQCAASSQVDYACQASPTTQQGSLFGPPDVRTPFGISLLRGAPTGSFQEHHGHHTDQGQQQEAGFSARTFNSDIGYRIETAFTGVPVGPIACSVPSDPSSHASPISDVVPQHNLPSSEASRRGSNASELASNMNNIHFHARDRSADGYYKVPETAPNSGLATRRQKRPRPLKAMRSFSASADTPPSPSDGEPSGMRRVFSAAANPRPVLHGRVRKQSHSYTQRSPITPKCFESFARPGYHGSAPGEFQEKLLVTSPLDINAPPFASYASLDDDYMLSPSCTTENWPLYNPQYWSESDIPQSAPAHVSHFSGDSPLLHSQASGCTAYTAPQPQHPLVPYSTQTNGFLDPQACNDANRTVSILEQQVARPSSSGAHFMFEARPACGVQKDLQFFNADFPRPPVQLEQPSHRQLQWHHHRPEEFASQAKTP